MTSIAPSGYRFATPAQWQSCLFAQAAPGRDGLRPLPPLAPLAPGAAPLIASSGAFAPTMAPTREVAWRDGAGRWHRTSPGQMLTDTLAKTLVEVMPAPCAIASARRVVATDSEYWAASKDARSVEVFDAATLARRFVVGLDGSAVVDLASLGRKDGVTVLRVHPHDGTVSVVRISCHGRPDAAVVLNGVRDALGFAVLAAPLRYVVLAADGRRLYAFDAAGGDARWRLALPTLSPGFTASAIGSDGRGRVFVAGRDGTLADVVAPTDAAHVLVLDGDGIRIDDVALAEPATGVAGARDGVWVTGSRGLYHLAESATVPDSLDEVRAQLLTPLLEAPDVPDGRRWLRVECRGTLPPGATLEIAIASTDDEALRDHVLGLANDPALPPSQRLHNVRAVGGLWQPPVVVHGSPATTTGVLAAAPLHDVQGRFLWVGLSLSAGAGTALPSIVQADVFYPGRTLMEQLPAIYQRDASRPGSFLRGLVGVLETTTQDLDSRIGRLGSNIHPTTAPNEWLDAVARWLGLPWDDTLGVDQKRALVRSAEAIARDRGTRAGLATVLDAIVAGSPARWRLRDITVDHGIAVVGGAACEGSRLPALLGGARCSSARLDVGATLGRLRLPDARCGDAEDTSGSRFLGHVLVSVAADAAAKALWSPWLERLLLQMLPIGTTLVLRWLHAGALDAHANGGVVTLWEPPDARLGETAAVGATRLRSDIASLPATSDRTGPRLH